jgi:hypothetical protein
MIQKNYIKKLYNSHSMKLSEFTIKSEIAYSPSSSCATGEHAADRLVTLSFPLLVIKNLQHETLQPQRVNTLEFVLARCHCLVDTNRA